MENAENGERIGAEHTGGEPVDGRSPLKLRFYLAIGGGVFFAAVAIGAIVLADRAGWIGDLGVLATVFAIVAAVNAVIVWWRIRRR